LGQTIIKKGKKLQQKLNQKHKSLRCRVENVKRKVDTFSQFEKMGGKSSKPKQRVIPPRQIATPPAWGQNSSLGVVENHLQQEVG